MKKPLTKSCFFRLLKMYGCLERVIVMLAGVCFCRVCLFPYVVWACPKEKCVWFNATAASSFPSEDKRLLNFFPPPPRQCRSVGWRRALSLDAKSAAAPISCSCLRPVPLLRLICTGWSHCLSLRSADSGLVFPSSPLENVIKEVRNAVTPCARLSKYHNIREKSAAETGSLETTKKCFLWQLIHDLSSRL